MGGERRRADCRTRDPDCNWQPWGNSRETHEAWAAWVDRAAADVWRGSVRARGTLASGVRQRVGGAMEPTEGGQGGRRLNRGAGPSSARPSGARVVSKHPPAEPGAFDREPLKAAAEAKPTRLGVRGDPSGEA